ncbi:MAG: hypothetical protein ACE5GJ_11360 [Gemmatimonadota bacterium]
MEQLIFVGLIVLFSILDAIARKKKKEQEEMRLPTPEGTAGPEGADQGVGRSRSPEAEGREVRGREEAATSEGMLPQDLWEELEALARPGPRSRPAPEPRSAPGPDSAPQPRPVPGAPSGPEVRPAPRTRPEPVQRPERRAPAPPSSPRRSPQPPARHPLHRAHSGYGTRPAERAAPAPMPGSEPGAAKRAQEEILEVHAMLRARGGSRRQAMVLREILGPPVSMRPGPPGPLGPDGFAL